LAASNSRFRARRPGRPCRIDLALIVILFMLAAILGSLATGWRLDRVAAWLFVPYAVWAAFALVLNGSILTLN
jgi:tryptophan-rich sensory protein